MKRALILTAAAAAALSLAACNKSANSNNPNASEGAQTGNPGQTEPVNKAQDTVGAAVGETSANTMGAMSTDAFVSNASQSDMYEIQAGQMAEQRSKNPEVKAFAAMMVKDHTAMSNDMKPLIAAAGQKPATDLDQRRKGFLDNLKAAPAADFDKTYIDQQVAGHKEALDLMKGYADHGSDAGLKGGAQKAIPKIQSHLDKAQQLQASLSQAKK
jgi:putative membrane protein